MPANPEIVDYIRRSATARGIDPEIALEVARREALNVFDPNQPDLGGDDRSSFGVYQLHYGGRSAAMPNAGLGDEFTARTGLRADDPSTWRQQVDFSLDWAKQHGWDPWMGAKAAGITGKMGIDGNPSTAVASTAGPQATPVSSMLAEATVPPPLWPTPQFDPNNPVGSTLSGLFSSQVAPSPLLPPARTAPLSDVINGGASTLPDAPPEFASANPPEMLPPPTDLTPPLAAVGQSDGGLADLFKVKDIGQAAAIDPATQQPVLARQRRAYG